MRHQKKGRKLGTDISHTKAMRRSLVRALLLNDRIKTIESRAKEIRPDVDKIITWAKKGDLHSRRLAISYLGDGDLVREVFEKVEQGMFKDRNGGYTRIMKLGYRKGDNAPMVIMEMVTETVVPKAARDEKKATTKSTAKRTRKAPKRVEDDKLEAKIEEAADENIPEAIEEVERIEETPSEVEETAEAEHAEEVREEQFEAEEAGEDEKAAENDAAERIETESKERE